MFAVGFVARPLGGLLFGRVSDRLGRKRALAMTMALGAFASLIIAIAPSYAMVGVFASVLLFVARVL